jgi:3-phosphoshikimate 1-carboxyvinyltransferase
MQVKCREEADGIWIEPSEPKHALIETFHDHRVAMAFAVTGVGTEGIAIADPQCCSKTFPEYFQVLDKVLDGQTK